ncbi:MAG: hypothetical protein V3W20_04895 [Candidatus Neomarinimicrobiota bacterium]
MLKPICGVPDVGADKGKNQCTASIDQAIDVVPFPTATHKFL